MLGPLRVAMLSTHSCPLGRLGGRDTGGMNVYVRELAREMGRRGHLVDVFTRAHDPLHEETIDFGANARLVHVRAGQYESIHKLAVYVHLPDFACNVEGFRQRNGLRYDVIFSHYWLSAWVGKSLQGWWEIPHLAMFHTLGAVKNATGIGEDEPELRIETERYLAGCCHRIIAATKQEKEDLVSFYGAVNRDIAVIPCGVDLGLFRPMDRELARLCLGLGENERVVLFVGRIEPLKGIDRLIIALAGLRKRHKARLVVIGGDDSSQDHLGRLQWLARELRLGDSVEFLGQVAQEELPRFYNAADVCVVPSFYESFGLVALESLACGTPVVINGKAGAASVVRRGETGYVLDDNSPGDLARKIDLLFSAPRIDAEAANSIRASVASLGWSSVAAAVERECLALACCAGRV
ncbi:MAG: glycosyltransferase [Chloroflexi bacterium]|nr:glycosyltransferase [Chloroflexota bacterium]